MAENYRNESRKNWSRSGTAVYYNDLQIGCLQRIADATELMAKRHQELVDSKVQAENSRDYWRSNFNSMERTNRSLRGQITKLKRKLSDCTKEISRG